ncbi:hypothetical protein HNQ99_002979 [Rhizorhapis suberifaciens]|uniref:Uncharacterized protein n=1 Tax=Rhizorhapis suberifaciens TaxID=13656 RepID=A0A840HXD7_9SPHN|nr:hypothetical protein [Rhizorhapis suberifaciens]
MNAVSFTPHPIAIPIKMASIAWIAKVDWGSADRASGGAVGIGGALHIVVLGGLVGAKARAAPW